MLYGGYYGAQGLTSQNNEGWMGYIDPSQPGVFQQIGNWIGNQLAPSGMPVAAGQGQNLQTMASPMLHSVNGLAINPGGTTGYGVAPLMSNQNAPATSPNATPQPVSVTPAQVNPADVGALQYFGMSPYGTPFSGGFNNPGQTSLYTAGPSSAPFSLGLGSPNTIPMGGM